MILSIKYLFLANALFEDSFLLIHILQAILMKKILLLFGLLIIGDWLSAQHLPLFTQYGAQAGIINPAAVSSDYFLYEHNVSFGGSYRKQWVGLESAPTTQVLQGQYMYTDRGAFNWIAGGYLINDQTGPTGFTGAYGRLAGIITDDPYYSGLSFGLSFGAVQYRVNVNELRLRESNDILTADNQAKFFPDFGLGAYYYRQQSCLCWRFYSTGFWSGFRV